MDQNSLLPLILTAAVILLIAAAVLGGLAAARKETQRKRETAQMLGFTPITPDAALTEKITALYRSERTTGQVELRNVARKTLNNGEIYLFDLLGHSANQETSHKADQEAAVFSTSLHLPPFKLFPNLSGEGAVAQLAAQAMRLVFAQNNPLVEFPDDPQFARHCMVVSPDADATRDFFTPARLNYLAHIGPVILKAGGGGFLCSVIDPQQARRKGAEKISLQVQQALDLLEMFAS
jgi:hypothetical protein